MFWQEKSMAIIGYARTSTRDQEAGLQAQIRDLIAVGCAERDIYTEQASSVRERPELDLLRRRILRPGDVLVVTRLDRLARSARDTLALAEEFGQRGVDDDRTAGLRAKGSFARGQRQHGRRDEPHDPHRHGGDGPARARDHAGTSARG